MISKLAGGSKVDYELEHKDSLPFKVKNLRIEEIPLDRKIDEEESK